MREALARTRSEKTRRDTHRVPSPNFTLHEVGVYEPPPLHRRRENQVEGQSETSMLLSPNPQPYRVHTPLYVTHTEGMVMYCKRRAAAKEEDIAGDVEPQVSEQLQLFKKSGALSDIEQLSHLSIVSTAVSTNSDTVQRVLSKATSCGSKSDRSSQCGNCTAQSRHRAAPLVYTENKQRLLPGYKGMSLRTLSFSSAEFARRTPTNFAAQPSTHVTLNELIHRKRTHELKNGL